MSNYDVLGNIAIIKFKREDKKKEKIEFAQKLLQNNKSIRTVLEKSSKFSGRLRTLKTKYILGEKTKEALCKENGCEFRLNVDSCYFSPRLAGERNEIASFVKRNERVLVMFGGVGVFAIVIAKNSKAKRIFSVELGRECTKYCVENVKRNKAGNVEIIQGDVRRVIPKIKEKFDRIIMARPNLKDDFLNVAFPKINKNGTIHYYGFYGEDKLMDLKELIERKARESKRKIKILKIKKAGDIGVRKFRYRVDIKVLN